MTMNNDKTLRFLNSSDASAVYEQLKALDYDDLARVRTNLYLDLQYIQDIRLGAILSLVQNEDEYQYVLSCMDDYNNRVDNKFASHFPELGLSEEELDEYIANPKYTKFLAASSPLTTAYTDFQKVFQDIHNHNTRIGELYPLYKVFVNIYPWKVKNPAYATDDLAKIIALIKSKIKYVHDFSQVYLVDYPTNSMPDSMLSTLDLLMIYDFEAFFSDEARQAKLFQKGLLRELRICTPIRFDHPIEDKEPDEIVHILKRGDAAMNLVSNFSYVHPKILIAPENDIGPEK